MKKRLLPLFLATLTASAINTAQATPDLLSQLKFTATEYLIYTDQLQKLDGSRCSHSAVSAYSVESAKTDLLQRLRQEDRSAFEALFQSAQIRMLLEENSKGIASVLGQQDLTQAPSELSEPQRNACLEYALVFQQNLSDTEKDLDGLFESYKAE